MKNGGGIIAAGALAILTICAIFGIGSAGGILKTILIGGAVLTGLALVAVIAGIVAYRKHQKAEETERILKTPVKSFAEEEAEGLADKYMGKKDSDIDAVVASLSPAMKSSERTRKDFETARNTTAERFKDVFPTEVAWTCSCGRAGNKGKFCADCGKPRG